MTVIIYVVIIIIVLFTGRWNKYDLHFIGFRKAVLPETLKPEHRPWGYIYIIMLI